MPDGGPPGPVDRLEDLGAAGADQPGEADDLTGVDGEGDVVELAGPRQAVDPEHLGSAHRPADGGVERELDVAAGHQGDDLARSGWSSPAGRRRRSGRP